MKTLYIVRGLPGSGKSSLGELLAPSNSFAADDYFTEFYGTYEFNPRLIGAAHNACQKNVEVAMQWGDGTIAVCNTFTQKWEAAPYFALAEKYGYSVFVIHCQNNFGNVHGVPDEGIEKMRARWDEDIRP